MSGCFPADIDSPCYKNHQLLLERIDRLEKENAMRIDTIACIDSAYDESHRAIENRLDKLEQTPCLIEWMNKTECRFDKLEEHKNRQIDENRKISEALDFLNHLNCKRIEENTLISRRLTEIEQHFSGDYQLVATKVSPYKCPVCHGSGAIHLENEDELNRYCKQRMRTDDNKWFIWCKSCEGKGILWG